MSDVNLHEMQAIGSYPTYDNHPSSKQSRLCTTLQAELQKTKKMHLLWFSFVAKKPTYITRFFLP